MECNEINQAEVNRFEELKLWWTGSGRPPQSSGANDDSSSRARSHTQLVRPGHAKEKTAQQFSGESVTPPAAKAHHHDRSQQSRHRTSQPMGAKGTDVSELTSGSCGQASAPACGTEDGVDSTEGDARAGKSHRKNQRRVQKKLQVCGVFYVGAGSGVWVFMCVGVYVCV